MRIGHGYDAHRFGDGERLVLGGVEIDYHRGLVAHSDGDVVIHALCDALLGGAGLGDIGRYFSDREEQYRDIDSRILLRKVAAMLADEGFKCGNADISIIAQEPKLAGYIEAMRGYLAQDLGIDSGHINIKATTTEGMGFTGRGEGIACHAVVVLVNQ